MINQSTHNHYARKQQIKNILTSIFRWIIIVGLAFIIIYPLIEGIIPALTHYNYLGRPNSIWVPLKFDLLSFRITIYLLDYLPTLLRTLLYSALMMIIQVFISALVGYGFSKLTFKGHNLLFFLVILTIVVPPQIIMLPQYFHFKEFDILGIIKLINGKPINLLGKTSSLFLMSFLGMGLRSGLFIFLFRQFFKGLPKELEEAAMIDGCGYVRTFFQIIIPNATAIIITVAVFSFVWNYGDVFYTGLFGAAPSSGKALLAQYLNERFTNQIYVSNAFKELTMQPAGAEPSPLLLGAVQGAARIMFILPLLVSYFFVQKKFVQSFERSGIVG